MSSKFRLFASVMLMMVFQVVLAQNQSALTEIKKVRKSCQKNGCFEYSLLQIDEDVALLDQPNGRKLSVLKNQIVLPLNVETREMPASKSQTWYEVKTETGQTGWMSDSKENSPTENNFVGLTRITDEEKSAILDGQKNEKKLKKISEAETLKRIENDDPFEILSIHEIKKVFNIPFASFKGGLLYFTDSSYEVSGAFPFKNCDQLTKLFMDKLKFKTYGSDPYEIASNNVLTFKGATPVTQSFQDSCLEVVDNNSVVCGNVDHFYEKLVAKTGPLLSFERGTMASGGCGPTYTSVYFENIDLRTGLPAVITDFFDEVDLIRALKKDDYVKSYFERSKIKNPKLVDYKNTLVLSGFAIYESKLHDGRMRIRWATAPTSCGLCLNNYSFVGLDVKPRPEFLELFKKLKLEKEIFLHENIKSLNLAE